jgi:hypothetical protein
LDARVKIVAHHEGPRLGAMVGETAEVARRWEVERPASAAAAAAWIARDRWRRDTQRAKERIAARAKMIRRAVTAAFAMVMTCGAEGSLVVASH